MAKRKKVIWVVNKDTNEMHRVVVGEPHPAECNFNQITEENKIEYPTAKAARADRPKVDAARHCNIRFKSRR